jgi:tetratricopeptide (TPR) repeat protein
MTESSRTLDQALQDAIGHHRARRWPEAERLYRAILQVRPDHPDANHNLGLLALHLGKPTAGLAHLKAALEANPTQGQYWLSYGEALLAAGRPADALAVLDQGGHCGLAGPPIEALKARILGQMKGGTSQGFTAVARACSDRIDRNHLAPAIADREAGRYRDAAHWLCDWLAGHPQDADAHAELAHALVLDGQTEAAAHALAQAEALAPQAAEVHRTKARLFLRTGRPAEALAAAEAAQRMDPGNPESALVLASALRTSGRDADALPLVEQALAVRPNYAEALANRALIRLSGGNFAEAHDDLEKALALKPHLGPLWGVAGTLRYRFNDVTGAISALKRALTHDPENVGHMVSLGEFLRQDRQTTAALAVLRAAVVLAPDNSGAWTNLGTALGETGQIVEAKVAYGRVLTLVPDSAEVMVNLGVLLRGEGRRDQALGRYRQALALRPDLVEALITLTSGYFDIGRVVEADDICRRGLISSGIPLEHFFEPSAPQPFPLPPAGRTFTRDQERCLEKLRDLSLHQQVMADWEGQLRPFLQARFSEPVRYASLVLSAIAQWVGSEGSGVPGTLAAARQCVGQGGVWSRKDLRSHSAYHGFLDALTRLERPSHEGNTDRQAVVIVGDSHCLSYHGATVDLGDGPQTLRAELIMGAKAWHLASTLDNPYRWRFNFLMDRLPEQATVVCSFGEIDCRIDEGILPFLHKSGEELDAAVARQAEDYAAYVCSRLQGRHQSPVFLGVPAPNFNAPHYPFGDTSPADKETLVRVIRSFNMRLKEAAARRHRRFVDLYAVTVGAGGTATGGLHIDNFHLKPDALALALRGG